MQRIKRAAALLGAAAAALTAACQDVLQVSSPNNPDRAAVLRLPRDVESLASRLYQNVHTAHFGANDNLDNQMRVASFENGSIGLSNFGMTARAGLPRQFIDNVPGGNSSVGNQRDFQRLTNTAGTAATIFERINTAGFTLGTSTQDDARLRAFTWFGYGVALGDLALAYDSAGIPRPGTIALDSLPLVPYDSVMRIALRALDSAQANAATASALPTTWLSSANNVSSADFVRLIRSYKARFRANVARTPAERAAVDWATVVADARAGITADFIIQLNPSAGWDYAWLVQHFVSAGWHSQTMYIAGMADSTGAYDAWLATPRDSRLPFIMRTADKRFPAGADRAAQVAAAPLATGNINTRPYWRAFQQTEEASGSGWQIGSYQHRRWRTLQQAVRVGPWITFSKVENDMLVAEGLLRRGDVAGALPLINASRTARGVGADSLPNLPAITLVSATAPVPGGQGCVPRVPDPARGYTATKCGDVFEAMKWEKRMESAFAGWSVWFFDSRGWGDLPAGTAVHWPVPFQELDARIKPYYILGGVQGDQVTPRVGGSAPSVTYGFGVQN